MNSYHQVSMFRTPFRVLTYSTCTKPPNMHLLVLLHPNRNTTFCPPTIICSSLSDDSFSIPKPTQARSSSFFILFYFILFIFNFFSNHVIMLFWQLGYSSPEELFGLEVELKPRFRLFYFIFFLSLSSIVINNILLVLYDCEFWFLACLILVLQWRNAFTAALLMKMWHLLRFSCMLCSVVHFTQHRENCTILGMGFRVNKR